GTSVTGLWRGLAGVHGKFITSFAMPAPLHPLVIAWCGIALLLAALAGRRPASVVVARVTMLTVLSLSCVTYVVETGKPLQHGLIDRGAAGALLCVATPMLWVLLMDGHFSAPRLLLCLVG